MCLRTIYRTRLRMCGADQQKSSDFMDEFEVVIIGAGVIGLAIARAAALRGHDVLVVDANMSPGMGISSRNSEVIHAGMYYQGGSLKARHCVRGRQMLYDYCAAMDLPHRKTGKLIVATSPQEDSQLDIIAQRAEENGVSGADRLHRLTRAQAQALEPEIDCTSALLSPSTGIIDSHAYMQQLMSDAENAGAAFSFGTRVEAIRPGPPHEISGVSQGEGFDLAARHLFVAAGLHSTGLTRDADLRAPQDYWLKGNYFVLNQRGPFQHLIYPVPVKGGLGVHVTLDMGGGTRFGPDTQPVEGENYDVDSDRAADFETAIRRYWPGLPEKALQPGYAGIRPKLVSPSAEPADFVIDGPQELNVDAMVALHGIESPGLTSSLSLAEAACEAMSWA